jgi:hypothetical protein
MFDINLGINSNQRYEILQKEKFSKNRLNYGIKIFLKYYRYYLDINNKYYIFVEELRVMQYGNMEKS